ncbi:hypothetical protein JOQ06_026531, partial [Pogonophryne albipinna]
QEVFNKVLKDTGIRLVITLLRDGGVEERRRRGVEERRRRGVEEILPLTCRSVSPSDSHRAAGFAENT